MFPYTDAQTALDLHHQRADKLRREATAHRLARSAAPGRPGRFGRRGSRLGQAARAPGTS